jgi:hypothetical protein
MKADGLIACISKFGPKETMDRLAAAVAPAGFLSWHVSTTPLLRPQSVWSCGRPRS